MKVVLIILLVLVLLVVFLLSLVINIKIQYSSGEDVFKLSLRILCFNFRLVPKKEKKPKKAKKKSKKNKESSDNKEKKSVNIFSKLGFSDTVQFVFDALSALFGLLSGVIRKAKLKKFRVELNVAQGDAAKTAITCGWASSVVYPVAGGILNSVKSYKDYEIRIIPDYDEDSKSTVDLEVVAAISVYSLIKVILSKKSQIYSVIKSLI